MFRYTCNVCQQVLTVRSADDLRATRILGPPMSQVLWSNRYPNRGNTHSSADGAEEDAQSDEESLADDREAHGAPKARRRRSKSHKTKSLSEGAPPAVMSQPRRRLRLVQNMPQPSLLATQVANRVIKYARYARNIHEEDMCCLDCGLFPICPVTGKCGHTRCTKYVTLSTYTPITLCLFVDYVIQ